jgi:hypothetical protein
MRRPNGQTNAERTAAVIAGIFVSIQDEKKKQFQRRENTMTKILIFHASLGLGHVSAVNSIAEALKQLGVDEI